MQGVVVTGAAYYGASIEAYAVKLMMVPSSPMTRKRTEGDFNTTRISGFRRLTNDEGFALLFPDAGEVDGARACRHGQPRWIREKTRADLLSP